MNLHPSSQNKPGTSEFCKEEESLPAFEDEPQDEQKPNVILMLITYYYKTCNTRAILSDASMSMSKSVHGYPVKTYYSLYGILLIVRGQSYFLLFEISSSEL